LTRINPVLFCAAGLLALTLAALALPDPGGGQFGIGYGWALDGFVALACVQGVIYGAAVVLLLRGARISLALVLGVAVLLRAVVLCEPPFLSNDLYRYIWDGWVQARGINPYRYVPADAHLAFLRDAVVYPNINRATYAHTIYPPGAEMLFLAVSRIGAVLSLPPVLAMRLGMLGMEAIGMAAMLRLLALRGVPPSRILIYAWNPLPVWEFASSGHVDAIAVCFVALALLAASQRNGVASAAALGLAVLTKFLPGVLAPALWRRGDWKAAGVFFAVFATCYLPYLSVGAGVFGFLGGYTRQEHLTSGQGVFLADLLGLSGPVYFLLFGAVLLVVAVWMLRYPNGDAARRSGLLIGVLMLGLSPHYPWYYAWALVPAVFVASPALIYLSCASFLLYLNPSHTQLFWPALVFIPFAVLGILESSAFLIRSARPDSDFATLSHRDASAPKTFTPKEPGVLKARSPN